METQTQTAAPVVPVEQSLLDRIVEQQAQVASRYMPVMDTEQVLKRMKAIRDLKELVLVSGVDYGVIPGTDKPVLLKPGAEKICAFFGYVPDIQVVAEIEDWRGERYGEPLFYYRYRVSLLKDGAAVGQGEGSANTWEAKYRWRNAARKCPACAKETIIKGKEDWGGGWLCWGKKGGCGAKFADGDKAIEGQEVGRVANPDFADVINTVQKMGQKRAYIAATLSATGASQWFTQDLEDAPGETIAEIQKQAGRVDTGGAAVGTRQAQANVAERKIAEARKPAVTQGPQGEAVIAEATNPNKLPVDINAIRARFEEAKSVLGPAEYHRILKEEFGVENASDFSKQGGLRKYQECYDRMMARANEIATEAVPA